MKRLLLVGAGIAAVVTVLVWRTQHGAEVWHTLPSSDPDVPS